MRKGGEEGMERREKNSQISPPKNCELDTRLPTMMDTRRALSHPAAVRCVFTSLKTVSTCVLTFPTVESIVPTEVSWRRRA